MEPEISKQFKHTFLPRYEITSEDTETGRFYTLPNDLVVPSVTTRIGRHFNTGWLEEWKERVGKEKADQVSTQAKIRGTAVHNIIEKFLKNDPNYAKGAMPVNLYSFLPIKSILLNNITNIYGIELPLYSISLNTAGRSDVFGLWKKTKSIIDFKTSKKSKTADDILDYFVQATCYAIMVRELYKIEIPQIVIVIMVDNDTPQIFEGKVTDYEELTRKVFSNGV